MVVGSSSVLPGKYYLARLSHPISSTSIKSIQFIQPFDDCKWHWITPIVKWTEMQTRTSTTSQNQRRMWRAISIFDGQSSQYDMESALRDCDSRNIFDKIKPDAGNQF